jgi:hypothetical protein
MTAIEQFVALRPAGGFDLIMTDPPWSFDNWSQAGEAKNAKARYDCTPLEWIRALGLDPAALPGWWQGWPPREHVRRWRDDLGLDEDAILAVAEASLVTVERLRERGVR